jgi:hypothetical protein
VAGIRLSQRGAHGGRAGPPARRLAESTGIEEAQDRGLVDGALERV